MPPPEQKLRNSNAIIKLRDPLITALLFLVPFYFLFWYFYTNRDMVHLGQARGTDELGDNPTTSVLAIFPGAFIIVPPFVSMWNTCKRVQAALQVTGTQTDYNNILAFVLFLVFSPAGGWYVQNELNKVWATETEGGGGALPASQAAPAPQAEQSAPAPTDQA